MDYLTVIQPHNRNTFTSSKALKAATKMYLILQCLEILSLQCFIQNNIYKSLRIVAYIIF